MKPTLPDDVSQWSDADIVAALVKSYRESVIPPCRVCGAALSMQACGGGKPTVWACDGIEDIPGEEGRVRRQEGRSCADEHCVQSEYIDYRRGGDDAVIEAIKRWRPDLTVEAKVL